MPVKSTDSRPLWGRSPTKAALLHERSLARSSAPRARLGNPVRQPHSFMSEVWRGRVRRSTPCQRRRAGLPRIVAVGVTRGRRAGRQRAGRRRRWAGVEGCAMGRTALGRQSALSRTPGNARRFRLGPREIVARSVPRYTWRRVHEDQAQRVAGAAREGRSCAAVHRHSVSRLRRILFRLQDATRPGDADAPGFRLHPLKGDRAGEWSVRVSGNWRVVFRFEGGEVVDVDLVDYH